MISAGQRSPDGGEYSAVEGEVAPGKRREVKLKSFSSCPDHGIARLNGYPDECLGGSG